MWKLEDKISLINIPVKVNVNKWSHSFVFIKFVANFRGQEDPATWAASIGNSWRTTGDIQDNWES